MPAISKHLTIEQGATWTQAFPAVDSAGAALTLSGYEARMQIRESAGGALIEEPALVISGSTITATLTADETRLISFEAGAYDIEIESPAGVVTRLYSGRVRIVPEVTATY